MMNYYFSLVSGDFTYSIDMIRLKTYIQTASVASLRVKFDLTCDEVFYNDGYGKFVYNWKFGNVWVGIGSKTKNKEAKTIFCIEFNPNKLDDIGKDFLCNVLNDFDFVVTRYDLAIDIPYNINQLYFGDLYKKSFSMFYNDYNNKTYYFGKGNGHTKIYNKKIESDLDFELTRYEVTIESDFNFKSGLPYAIDTRFITVCRTPYFSLCGDDSLDAILYAVNNGFPFKSLSRRYKEYVKKDFIRFE